MTSTDPGTDRGADPGLDQERPGVTCARCGDSAEGLPLTWSTAVQQRGARRSVVRYCERCSRENVRAIEGRLDEQWW